MQPSRESSEATTTTAEEAFREVTVCLPGHLRTLANVGKYITLGVTDPVTPRRLLDVLEEQLPSLRGTIRDHATGCRRAYLRFYACEEDISHDSLDEPLPHDVVAGTEPFIIMGAVSGG